jgi:hypothetical protein
MLPAQALEMRKYRVRQKELPDLGGA